TMTVRPFIDSELFDSLYRQRSWFKTAAGLGTGALLRLRDVLAASNADVIFVPREAMLLGPPAIVWFTNTVLRRPLVFYVDDATYVPYTRPTYGRFTKALKFFGKTDYLIRWSRTVVCGNQTIAEYVSSKGGHTEIIPTVVDLEKFRPRESRDESVPVLGW